MLEIKDLNKSFSSNGNNLVVFKDFQLTAQNNQILSIFGPNGCGKSTLLDILAGFSQKDGGTIEYNGKQISQNQMGIVLQDYRSSLFPWLTIEQNIALPLKIKKVGKDDQLQEVINICERFQFKAALKAYPYQLSGGQQQFVAILRALITHPKILLMDEPFSSLDFDNSLMMQEKIADILHKAHITTIFVSHDIDSSIILSDQIVLLSNTPTRVVKAFTNHLQRPRTATQMTSPIFTNLKKAILKNYYQEIIKSKQVDFGDTISGGT